jgi:carbon-monoxide dehydrogenase medium subunit
MTEYVRPASIDEAIAALRSAGGDAIILAGGVVVGSIINQKFSLPGLIVDISRLEALRKLVRTADGSLAIGALVTHDDVVRSTLVRETAPLLSEIASDIACGRVRNRGTIGGSLCTIGQQGDPATGLTALNATIRLQGPDGGRTVAVEDFYQEASIDLRENEILEEVSVPPVPPRSGFGFRKIGPRAAMDFTLIAAASGVVLDDDGAVETIRLAINGAAPSVVRPKPSEACLVGQNPQQLDWTRAAEALQDTISPQTDLVYSEAHKRHLALVAVRRATETAVSRALAASRDL